MIPKESSDKMGFLTFLVSITAIIFTAIYIFFKRRYTIFEKEGVSHIKPRFPFGNIQGLGSKYHMVEVLMNVYNELKNKGPICGFYNLAEPIYLVTDIELVKDILVKDFNNFVNRGEKVEKKLI